MAWSLWITITTEPDTRRHGGDLWEPSRGRSRLKPLRNTESEAEIAVSVRVNEYVPAAAVERASVVTDAGALVQRRRTSHPPWRP